MNKHFFQFFCNQRFPGKHMFRMVRMFKRMNAIQQAQAVLLGWDSPLQSTSPVSLPPSKESPLRAAHDLLLPPSQPKCGSGGRCPRQKPFRGTLLSLLTSEPAPARQGAGWGRSPLQGLGSPAGLP